ncbi:NAD(P)H-hydrate dehydratase [Halopseudomonas litoralis]|nr:NAD(P)H-hydrate dehydratase [Halopseudomonas litoralis]
MRLDSSPSSLDNDNAVPGLERLDLSVYQQRLPARPRDAHKGMFGHLLVIGGNQGMGGAVMLAAEAALRCGAGKVSVATLSEHIASLLARCPEVMAHGVDDPAQLPPLLSQASTVVLGPGLGRDAWAEQMLIQVLEREVPRILDADALNGIASMSRPIRLGCQTVITPHPAEAARLLACRTADIQADRLTAAEQLAERFACAAVLKGVGSLVAGPGDLQRPGICMHGNPGMASAGMGDVLSGVVGALLAQHLDAGTAARYAVLLHALAGDRVAEQDGQLGMLASDLISSIRYYLNRNI